MKIAIIDYGAGNVCSVDFALRRLGYRATISSDPNEIISSDKVIFPGVGQASSAMAKIRERKLDKLIPNLKQPVLGICLGMQLMCDFTEEGQTRGLGIFNQRVEKFVNKERVPQIGWNEIFDFQLPLFQGVPERSYFYLAHSYYVPINDYTVATANYGQKYSAAMIRDNFFCLQFHPEKSGLVGANVLQNFIKL